MKIVSLTGIEAAVTGFTHLINLKVTVGGITDLVGDSQIQDVIPIPIGMWVKDAAIDVKTAWATITAPTISVGIAASGVTASDILSAVDLSVAGFFSASSTGIVVNDASQYITITQNGTGTNATAGEANILLRIADLTHGRRTFATV